MPKRTDIKSILIIGAGPIIIGQACEFDYSGVQACKALREEGYKVILINSNPATIMTDPATADVTYIEPITWQTVEKIIARERPDAILPTMGGQTALNCALDLHKPAATPPQMSTPPAAVEPEYTMTGTIETVLSQFSPKPASQRFTLQNHKLLRVSLGPGVLAQKPFLRCAYSRAPPGPAQLNT